MMTIDQARELTHAAARTRTALELARVAWIEMGQRLRERRAEFEAILQTEAEALEVIARHDGENVIAIETFMQRRQA